MIKVLSYVAGQVVEREGFVVQAVAIVKRLEREVVVRNGLVTKFVQAGRIKAHSTDLNHNATITIIYCVPGNKAHRAIVPAASPVSVCPLPRQDPRV